MKTKILEINNRLSKNIIDYKEARIELCKLFDVKYKPKYTGKAIVKSSTIGQKWRYDGHTLNIIGLSMVNVNGYGVYPDGTREFKLSLKGTEWEYDGQYTVIAETDLEILELNID